MATLRGKCAQPTHGRSPQDFDTIDWHAHAQALQRQSSHRTTFVKYLHNILPIGKRVHKYNMKYQPCCPSCQAQLEDTEHVWKCQAPHRLAWRTAFFMALQQRLQDLHTKPLVRALLIGKVKGLLDDVAYNDTGDDPDVTKICTAQAKIGWHHILKGRFSVQWNNHGVHPSHRQQHSNWTVEVIDCIFTNWWQLWEIRNKDRHGHDISTRNQADTVQTHRELDLLYERYEAAAPQHLQWLFHTDSDTKKQWSTPKLRQWLSTWQPVLEDKIRPSWAPTNPENYPYQTQLETG